MTSRSRRTRDRRGVALPLALFTLVILAVMITAVFYVGRLEQRMGYNSLASTQAFETAEAGASAVLSSWAPSTYNGMSIGTTLTIPSTAVGSNSTYSGSVRRLNSTLFLIQIEGRYLVAGQAITRRQIARLIRLDPPALDPEAPLTSRIGLEVGGSAQVSGVDQIPPAWGAICPFPGPTASAIRDSSGLIITSGGCAGMTCLTGTGPVDTDPTVTSDTFNVFGAQTFVSLSAAAEKIVTAPSNNLGSLGPTYDAGPPVTCRFGDLQNWGDPDDPTSPCGDYFPLIYAPGDITLSGGSGQGILLVDGNLTLSGGARFYGIIIVQGTVNTNGGQVMGALMVDDEFATPTLIAGTTLLDYSRCAISRAVSGASQPSALHERSWVQLY
jgi:hypothetical protein